MDTRFALGPEGGTSVNPANGVIMHALTQYGSWSPAAMRAPGFQLIDRATAEDRAFAEFRAAQSAGQFRTAAPLPDKAQVSIDMAVTSVGLQRLSFVKELYAQGLTYNLPDPLSVTQLEFYKGSKIGAAQRSMSPEVRTENKLVATLSTRLPVYITMDGFNLDIRLLKQSQRFGMPLDVEQIKQCTRAVNESVEDAAINGATTLDGQALVDAGYSVYGLLNAPNANTTTPTIAAWTTAPVGATVFTELEAMITLLQGDKYYGPYTLFVPTVVGNAFDADYKTSSAADGLTIRERLLKIPTLTKIVVCDLLPATKVALVQMTSNVVDIVDGMRPTVVPWTSASGMTFHNLVMAIQIPRFRSDYDGNSGVCIGTLT